MGEDRYRSAGQRNVAIAVRYSADRHWHGYLRRLSAGLADRLQGAFVDTLYRPVWRRPRTFSVVDDRRKAPDHHRFDRRAARPGGWRARIDNYSGRAAYADRHHWLRLN